MKKLLVVFAASFALAAVCATQRPSTIVPEAGFTSPQKYTNGFFGFSMPLPQDPAFREFIPQVTREGGPHFLFGLQALKPGLVAFIILAKQQPDSSMEDARNAVSQPKSKSVQKIAIAGRDFWKGESDEKGQGGKMQQIAYATALDGYILQFQIDLFDAKAASALEHCVESLSFFDPAKAQEVAGAESHRFSPLTRSSGSLKSVPSSTRIAHLQAGTISGNTYRNDELGFRFEFPAGWVVNDKATQDDVMDIGHQFAWGNNPTAAREHEIAQGCGRPLLMVTKAPEGTKTETLNSLIFIFVADLACGDASVQFPTSLDDHDGIRQIGQQLIRMFDGTPFMSKGQNSLKASMVQGHVLLEFSRASQISIPSRNVSVDVYTSMNFSQSNGYLICLGFETGANPNCRNYR